MPGEYHALDNVANSLIQVGRFDEAITVFGEAAAISRETGQRFLEASALNDLGVALRKAGRLDEAITVHQEAAAISRETGNRHGEADVLANLKADRAAQQT